jgi:hypothetical protein
MPDPTVAIASKMFPNQGKTRFSQAVMGELCLQQQDMPAE